MLTPGATRTRDAQARSPQAQHPPGIRREPVTTQVTGSRKVSDDVGAADGPAADADDRTSRLPHQAGRLTAGDQAGRRLPVEAENRCSWPGRMRTYTVSPGFGAVRGGTRTITWLESSPEPSLSEEFSAPTSSP